VTRQLLTSTVTILLVVALGVPVAAEDAPPSLVERINRLPTDLIKAKKSDGEIVEALFLATLVRLPTEKEKDTVTKHLANGKDREETARDLAWALVNTKEFLKLHEMDKDVTASLRVLNALAEKWGKDKAKK
jgi:hypothetical protein